VQIRREGPVDHQDSESVQRAAFARRGDGGEAADDSEPIEVGLLRALRLDAGWVPELSWVAEDDGRIVGHVVCTEGRVGDTAVVGLGPIGVLPEMQGRHLGHALMRSVIGAADALGYPAVVLLGDPAFYSRFGFVQGSEVGIDPPEPAWGTHFQARTLATFTPELRGGFRYAAPFDDL
jgi:putative acetyltransferase